jgi:hypothetical protein
MSFFRKSYFTECDNVISNSETLLRLIKDLIQQQNASDGMILVDMNAPYSGVYDETDFYGFVVREDTVVNQLEVDGEYVQDDYGLTGRTLTTSDPAIMAPRDEPFDRIKLTSGSVWVLLKV